MCVRANLNRILAQTHKLPMVVSRESGGLWEWKKTGSGFPLWGAPALADTVSCFAGRGGAAEPGVHPGQSDLPQEAPGAGGGQPAGETRLNSHCFCAKPR